MLSRVLVFSVMLLLAVVTNAFWDIGVQPTAAAGYAVAQLEDSNTSATALRAFSGVSNNIPLITWGLVALGGVVVFRKPVMDAIQEVQNDGTVPSEETTNEV